MSEYDRIAERATAQFEGPEIEPDWEWAKEEYARGLRKAVIKEYAIAGKPLPHPHVLATIIENEADRALQAAYNG